MSASPVPSTMNRRRAWKGVAFLGYGFRPFFFSAAVLSSALIAVWIPWYFGWIALPSAFPPLDWHAHELLFGYVPAVIAGFLLTAVPNWTGRLPVVGWPLGALFALWVVGRVVVALSSFVPPLVLFGTTIAFPVALFGVIAREIMAGKNWRNLKVLTGLGLIIVSQCLFYYEVWHTGRSAYGARLAIAATILLITIIGGRIVPSFTRNWIKRDNPGPEPAGFGSYDKAAMILGGAALATWVFAPTARPWNIGAGALLIGAAVAHAYRLARWTPWRTFAEPLVAILHVAYAFVPLGLLLAGLSFFVDVPGLSTAAIHAFTVGAIGLMTLAVMTRASRGHSGRPLTAPKSTQAIYLLVILAALARIAAAVMPEFAVALLPIAGLAWTLGFACFAVFYGPMLLRASR